MKGVLNKSFEREAPVVTAVELFSSGWCNLACRYCYIPKTEFLKDIHATIIEKIKDGSFIKELKDFYGDELESISHWGTEPTLTVKLFKQFYEEAIVAFPKLKEVKISSNFMTPPSNLIVWVTEILPQDRKLEVAIQVSHDGPAFITDKNRIGGSTQQIIDNCLEVIKGINDIGTIHDVKLHLKPTIGDDDMRNLAEYDNMKEYYEFFDDFMVKVGEANHRNMIGFSKVVDPTIVLPGAYTSTDGKYFYKMYQNQMALAKLEWRAITSPNSNYYYRWTQKRKFYKEFFTKQHMFTCSAGDTCFALGDNPGISHMCHQSFYLDHPTYYDEARKYGLDEQTMEGIASGRMDLVKDHFIIDKNDPASVTKMQYVTRVYNDFVEMKMSGTVAQILELAHVGQINPIYKDEAMAAQLSYFIQTTDCPMDNTMISASQLVNTLSISRLFGNGVFEAILKRVLKETK